MKPARARRQSPTTVYLALGTNLGEREHNLRRALELLPSRVKVEQLSPVYDTAPAGDPLQPRFLNMVCRASTVLPPRELLAFVKKIEEKLGRVAGPPNRPRPIDIDILLYGDTVLSTPELTIPHPRLTERAFVLVPLADIAPDFWHSVSGKTIAQLLLALPRSPPDVIPWQGG